MDIIRVAQATVGEEEWLALKPALERGYYGHAEKVVEFEHAIAKYLGCVDRPVVCVSSGTAALHLALLAAGISRNDEVLVPSLTFVGSYQAITATGAMAVSCDVQEDNFLIDLRDAEAKVTDKTRAIMPVHYAGNPGALDEMCAFAKEHGLRIVEDAAHALGSEYKGRKIGVFGDLVCFSFDSLKNITCGEGGAVICPDEVTAERIRLSRLLGMNRNNPHTGGIERQKMFSVETQGYRYHMSNLNAAIGLVQLGKIDSFIGRRRTIARKYDTAFRPLYGLQPLTIDYSSVAPHIYTIRVFQERRDDLVSFLASKGIETAINYIPNHLHPMFAQSGIRLEVTEKVFGELLNLPLHCSLSEEDVDRVIDAVKRF